MWFTAPALASDLAEDAPEVRLEAWSAVVEGKPVVGLTWKIEPGWHLYWENPGDSGLATSAHAEVPSGWVLGDVRWVGPDRMVDSAGLVSYGWSDLTHAMWVVESSVPGRVSFASKWLACRDRCVPGESHATLPWKRDPRRRLAAAVADRFPVPSSAWAGARWEGSTLFLPGAERVEWFPSVGLELLSTVTSEKTSDGIALTVVREPGATGVGVVKVFSMREPQWLTVEAR